VTSLVPYAPCGAFLEQAHLEGEEILVLKGAFAEEHGHCPQSSSILGPNLGRHQPFSEAG
jgi:anti-sigma factor ChrR (cupin superfamily)